jgi:AcrR family transcriptional regulator
MWTMETATAGSQDRTERVDRVAARAPKVVPEEVMRAARKMFLATGSLEMRALAREIGVGRATLYRWNRSREELLGEVVLSLAVANLRRAEADVATEPGPARVCDVHDLHLRRVTGNRSLRRFVGQESDTALRVLLDANGRVHVGVTRALADFIRAQEAAAGWRAPLGADGLAAVVSRLSEAFIYGDLIARAEPDARTPDMVLRMMLGVSTRAP